MIKPIDILVQDRDLLSLLAVKVCVGLDIFPVYQSVPGRTEFEDIKVFHYINTISHQLGRYFSCLKKGIWVNGISCYKLMVFMEGLFQCDVVYEVSEVLPLSLSMYIYAISNDSLSPQKAWQRSFPHSPISPFHSTKSFLLIYTQVVISLRQRLFVLAFIKFLAWWGDGHTGGRCCD